jgi:hypothetical protein
MRSLTIYDTHTTYTTPHTSHPQIADVKDKLRTHIGTHAEHQRLILKHDGNVIGELKDDTKMLGYYSVVSGNEIHVIDTDPFSMSRGGGLTDVSLIEKYRMDDEVCTLITVILPLYIPYYNAYIPAHPRQRLLPTPGVREARQHDERVHTR